MQSFVIATKNKEDGITCALRMCDDLEINSLDIYIQELTTTQKGKPSESIGIAEIRAFQKNMYLKPFQGNKKAGIIQNAQLLTLTAQQALLKLLEEPPLNTFIILLVTTKELLLPTILSRCSVIILKEKEALEKTADGNILREITTLASKNLGEKLKLAQEISTDKKSVLLWIEKTTLALRNSMFKKISDGTAQPSDIFFYLRALKSLKSTNKILTSSNASVRFALEIFFLSL